MENKKMATNTYPFSEAKTVLITGCSTGFGFLTALEFANNGYKVFATMRNPNSEGGAKLRELADAKNLDLSVLQLDVRNDLDIKSVFETIGADNPIDILINNAAYGYLSEIESIDLTKYLDQVETNIFGAVRLIKQVLPSMKTRQFGRIVNVGSILSFINIPKYGPYSSTKHALESLSLTADLELAKYNIRSVMVDPGSFPTNFGDNKVDNASGAKTKDFDYDNLVTSRATKVSKLIFKISQTKNPKPRYVVGYDSMFGAILNKLLPTSLFYKLIQIYTSNVKQP